MPTPAQIRAARHLVSLSQAEIAERARLSLPTVKRAESDRQVSVSGDAVTAIQAVLEEAGVLFIPENGGGAGVRLKFNRREVKAIDSLENEGGIVGEDDV